MIRALQMAGSILASLLFFNCITLFAQSPDITSTSPYRNELNVPIDTNISVEFDANMDTSTILKPQQN